MIGVDEAADVLERAADLLESGPGWCQRTYLDSDGRMCMLGAVRRAAGWWTVIEPDRSRDAYVRAEHAHNILDAFLGMPVAIWNDQHGRTADEVVDKLKHAAKSLRGLTDKRMQVEP